MSENEMCFELKRLESFANKWPHNFIRTTVLAKTGFHYIGPHDEVKCHFCEVILKNWMNTDNEITEHFRWSSNCKLINQLETCNKPINPCALAELLPSSLKQHLVNRCESCLDNEDVCGLYKSNERPLSSVIDFNTINILKTTRKNVNPLYSAHTLNLSKEDITEIVIGISPYKSFTVEIFLLSTCGNIIPFNKLEFIGFLNDIKTMFSINIDFCTKFPSTIFKKIYGTKFYEVKLSTNNSCYLEEYSLIKLAEIKQYLLLMIYELENKANMYEIYFKKLVAKGNEYIKNVSKFELTNTLLCASDYSMPKKFILETALKFEDLLFSALNFTDES